MPGYATGAEAETGTGLRGDLEARYGARREEIRVVRSPYRVSPLGAHVDHQLGCVTGLALDRSVLLAFAPSGSSRSRLTSLDYQGEIVFDLDDVPPPQSGSWGNYALGAVLAIRSKSGLGSGALRSGIDGVLRGSLPVGGASSSSAVGVAYLLALEAANGLSVSAEENIALDQFIENAYLGLRNGILDQSVILLSRRDELLHLDCRTRRRESVRFGGDPTNLRVLLVHSGVARSLISTDYNRHVAECREAAAALLRAAGEPVPEDAVLGLVPNDLFTHFGGNLPERLYRRALHFFSETARVLEGVKAWAGADLARFGALMKDSCLSSIQNYRCGCPELITLFEILAAMKGVYGCRFSGAGYGGACVALVDVGDSEGIAATVRSRYLGSYPERERGFAVFSCSSADGACVLDVE